MLRRAPSEPDEDRTVSSGGPALALIVIISVVALGGLFGVFALGMVFWGAAAGPPAAAVAVPANPGPPPAPPAAVQPLPPPAQEPAAQVEELPQPFVEDVLPPPEVEEVLPPPEVERAPE
jgi:hypothetical protein